MTQGVDASIVIPVRNGAATLARCLDALETQRCPETRYEILVVDDGSTDATAAIASRPRVTTIRQEPRGPATARNRGARAAQGNYLLFTDADCVPEPGWIAEMVRPFEDAEVVGVKGAYLNGSPGLWARFAQLEFEERYRLLSKRRSIDMVDTHAAAFRRERFLSMGGFDESFPAANNEDTELSYRLASEGCLLVFAPSARVTHLRHPDSLARYARLKYWRGYWRIAVYRLFPRKAVADSYTPQSLKLQVLAAGLLVASPLGLFVTGDARVSAAALVLWVASALPFTLFAIRRDAVVGLLAPFFLFVRALALGAGTLHALIRPAALRKPAQDARDAGRN